MHMYHNSEFYSLFVELLRHHIKNFVGPGNSAILLILLKHL